MTINQVWQYGGLFLATICCAWAWHRGGPTERRGAIIIFVGWTLSFLLQSHAKTGPGIWVNIIDICGFFALFYISVQSRRLWTLFACASQLDAIASHISQVFEHFGQWAYFVIIGVWSGYGLLICLAAGVISYRWQLRRVAERTET
jgi:hypothetical protein